MRIAIVLWTLPLLALGCSSSSPAGSDGGTDSGSAAVNGCTTFEDDTASGATVTGPSGATPSQYVPNCVHIKVGQSVTWNVDLTAHPLEASGGDTPSPIQTTNTGTTVSFTFPNAGTFGFHCQAHPSVMQGAVEVTP